MPPKNGANKIPARKPVETTQVDLGQTLANRKSQDFRAKIEGWNVRAGVDQETDVIPVEEPAVGPEHRTNIRGVASERKERTGIITTIVKVEGEPAVSKTPPSGTKAQEKQASPRKTSKELDASRQAWVRRKPKAETEVSPDVKVAVTPKKRVVSDEHWRKDRPQKENATPQKSKEKEKDKDNTPKPITIRRSVVSVGLKVPPSVQAFEEEPEVVKFRPVVRRSRSRSESRPRGHDREATPEFESSGTKVYVKRHRRSKTGNEEQVPKISSTSASSFAALSSPNKPSTATDITTPETPPTREAPIRPRTAPRERMRRRTSVDGLADNRDAEPSFEAEDAVRRPRRRRTKSPSPEDHRSHFAKAAIASLRPPGQFDVDASRPPKPVPRVYGNRIEGWLAGMPEDPFCPPSETADELAPLANSRRAIAQLESSLPARPTGLRRPNMRLTSEPAAGNRDLPLDLLKKEDRKPRVSDAEEPSGKFGGLERRLTKHDDLISVLSLSRNDERGIVPARSTRRRYDKDAIASVPNVMNEVTTEELKYQRELRTLVDGVIPVLLQYVLSKANSSDVIAAQKNSHPSDPALTQPIVEMGVVLERLRTSHKRVPMHDADDLLSWAQNTAKIYVDYLRVFRLGFSDIVVSLAPAEENTNSINPGQRHGHTGSTNNDAERADVAHLLKRPLVRIKTLAKTMSMLQQIKPSSLGDSMVDAYQDMVNQARKRLNDEKARLEDEAAAAIDPNRARDPHSLVALGGVAIDPSRCVRARDFFDMELLHSTGQQLDCKVELIMRDDDADHGGSGDILFCEVSATGKWLLFPPVLRKHVSARKGTKNDEIVVMVRGQQLDGSDWREIMTLRSSDEQAPEWVDLLGTVPVPPMLNRQSSLKALMGAATQDLTLRAESQLPIGERAKPSAQQWDGSEVNSNAAPASGLRRTKAKRYRNTSDSPLAGHSPIRREVPEPGRLYRGAEDDTDQRGRRSSDAAHPGSTSRVAYDRRGSNPGRDNEILLASGCGHGVSSDDEEERRHGRPAMHRRTSSVPSNDMPVIHKIRSSKLAEGYTEEGMRTPLKPSRNSAASEDPASAPAKLQKRQSAPSKAQATEQQNPSQSTLLGLRSGALPSFTPAFMKRNRRSSSPLKHEYEPSTASESSADSDLSELDDVESVTSESLPDEAVSTVGELKDFRFGGINPRSQPRRPHVVKRDSTVAPSESASQAPYRTVPQTETDVAKSIACVFSWSNSGAWDSIHPDECEIVITPGLIEAFDLAQANAAMPGSTVDAGASPSTRGVKALVALELTPLVPLRRGTALDISIRSPPTARSVLRNGSNFMFRSRTPEECGKLYALINRARIDNPTWIALQNARGPVATSNWASVMDKRNSARTTSSASWLKTLSRKGSTYRSKGARSASIAASQSSIATDNTTFSALRKISAGSRFFDVAKSTIMSKHSTRSSYTDSLSSGAATPARLDPSLGTPVGITNAKIRLYLRESASKWRDLGSARLTIMLPPRQKSAPLVADPRTTGQEKRVLICGKSHGETILDVTLGESCFERVARTGIAVSIWEETLGPEGVVGRAAATGGVMSSKTRVYMVQMKSERDAAYTFSMVGKLRY